MNGDIWYAAAGDIAGRVRRREVSARDVVAAHLDRAARHDRRLNAFIRMLVEPALDDAGRVDDAVRRGAATGPLAGVPVAVKDLVDVGGVPTTAGAHARFHTTPDADAPVVRRLREAGAVILGKTGLHEFAYGVTNVNPHFGPVRNPWDPTRIPGGSSGGSAAAVAAGFSTAALGTDTGGSVRIPAALCGVVGLKPTYGRVPTTGVVPLAWSLDHVGPMTRTVADAALLFHVLAGIAPDARSPDPSIRGLRVGVPRGYFWERLDRPVETCAQAAVDVLAGLGASVVEVALPHAEEMVSAVAVILSAEATAYHQRSLLAHGDAYGTDVRIRLDRGLFVTATEYLTAMHARRLFIREALSALAAADVLVTPTTVCTATPIEADATASLRASPQLTRCTYAFNVTGLPALSVPCGFAPDGLPVGLQFAGKPNDEAMVLRVGQAYEDATGWHRRRPQL